MKYLKVDCKKCHSIIKVDANCVLKQLGFFEDKYIVICPTCFKHIELSPEEVAYLGIK